MTNTRDLRHCLDNLISALNNAGARFKPLELTDDISGVADYDEYADALVFDVLILSDDQDTTDGRYLFRHIDRDPMAVPVFELQTDDLDAIIASMRSRNLLT